MLWLADFFSGEGGRSSSASHGHFRCLLLTNFLLWHCSFLIGSAFSLECNQSGCGGVHFGYARSIFLILCDDQKYSPKQDRLRWQTPDVRTPLICVVNANGSRNALSVSTSILAHFYIPVSLHNKNVLLRRMGVGSGQVLWTCTGRNKTLPPSTSLPGMGEIAGVNTTSLGRYLHSSKTRARWAEGFHDERVQPGEDGLRQVVPCL